LFVKNANQELVQRWWDQLERFSRILGRVGPDEICCEGLTQRQCAILRTLIAQEGARLSDLAASSGITPSAMTRVLERLEARGLVERVRGSHPDGRTAVVRISAAGRRTRKLLDELMRERTSQIIRAVSAKQRTLVLKALETLNAAIEAADFCGLNAPVHKLRKAGRSRGTRS
jgi:DNA-binding MarR family transcriptional regulator